MLIADKNSCYYSIIIKNNPSKCNVFSAEELSFFIEKCVGVKMPINSGSCQHYISLGNTEEFYNNVGKYNFDEYGTDGFIIKAVKGNLYVNGKTDRAVLFGVYDFIEKFLGVRFIAVDTTYLPKKEKLQVDDNLFIKEIPDFSMRGYLEKSMFEDIHSSVGTDHDFALRKRAHHSFLKPDEKHGGRCAYWGRNSGAHNFTFYVKPSIYNNPDDKEHYHPEFFAYWHDGEQEKKHRDEGDFEFIAIKCTTVCLSNGITDDGRLDESMDVSVAKIMIEELKKDIKENSDIVYFDVSQEDGYFFCECEKCKRNAEKYKRSGMLIRFCNVIADELQKWSDKELGGRTIKIVTFGYSYTSEPPVIEKDNQLVPIDETVKPHNNVVLRLALGRDCYYDYFDDRQIPATLDAMKKWKVLSNSFFGWIYDAFFDRYLLYMPSIQTIHKNIVGLKEYGVEYLMINGAYNTSGLWQDIMKAYIYQAEMWNAKLETEPLMDEFLFHYFGEIGMKCVKEYMKRFDEFFKDYVERTKTMIWIFAMKSPDAYPKKLLTDALEMIIEARKEVSLTEKDTEKAKLYDKHLAQVQLGPMFPLCEHFKHYFPEKTEEDYIAYAKEWVALCSYAGVTRYHEQLTVQSFVDANYIFPY